MAAKYAVTLHFFNGKADTPKELAPIEVARSAATLDTTNPAQPLLVLPVDVSKAKCNSGADVAAADVDCGPGKYRVMTVKALPVHAAGQYSGSDGSAQAGPWLLPSFVGAPEAPANVAGVSAAAASGQVAVTFDRPAADNAAVRGAWGAPGLAAVPAAPCSALARRRCGRLRAAPCWLAAFTSAPLPPLFCSATKLC